MISRVYGSLTRARRRYYAARPERRRRLLRPVISVGNLAVGGRGKTPLVAALARQLIAAGERPSILSRGYARRAAEAGVVVVSDPGGLRADLDRAGDEPLMLARQLEGVAVLASSSRYLAGRLAEHHFGCTVHLLDDGFQHLDLHRDIDLVIVAGKDVTDARTLPGGRLREPLDAARAADAILALDSGTEVQTSFFSQRVWHARRRLGAPRLVEPFGEPATPAGGVLAVAGIAAPERFFGDLRAAGWPVARELSFRDHHRYSHADVAWIFDAAHATAASMVVTTEKDLMRLLPFRPFPLPLAWAPLTMLIEPAERFQHWLLESLDAVRQGVDV